MCLCWGVGGAVTRTRFQSHKGVPPSIIPVRYLAEIFKYIRNTLAAGLNYSNAFKKLQDALAYITPLPLHYEYYSAVYWWGEWIRRAAESGRARPTRRGLLLFLAFQTRHLRITTLIGARREIYRIGRSAAGFARRRVSRRFQLAWKNGGKKRSANEGDGRRNTRWVIRP